MLGIPLTFSIAEGIGLGLICAALLTIARSESKKMTTFGYLVAGVFFLEFFKIWPFRA